MVNTSIIVHSVRLTSSTKDSLHVSWDVYDRFFQNIQGYRVQYQAMGSRIIQHSEKLEPDKMDYDILQLHENTYYEICVKVVTNLSSTLKEPEQCMRATTATDSLSVALGSTFGAFLALGVIVMFVFIAKWQHTRRLKQQLQNVPPPSDTYESIGHNDGDFEMSDVSLQVHEGTTPHVEFSSQSDSQLSGQNSMKRKPPMEVVCDEEITDSENNTVKPSSYTGPGQAQVLMNGGHSETTPIAIDPPPPNLKSKRQQQMTKQQSIDKRQKDRSRQTSTGPSDGQHEQNQSDPQTKPLKIDYGGARPKNTAVGIEPLPNYANKSFLDSQHENPPGLRPNNSCNW